MGMHTFGRSVVRLQAVFFSFRGRCYFQIFFLFFSFPFVLVIFSFSLY